MRHLEPQQRLDLLHLFGAQVGDRPFETQLAALAAAEFLEVLAHVADQAPAARLGDVRIGREVSLLAEVRIGREDVS